MQKKEHLMLLRVDSEAKGELPSGPSRVQTSWDDCWVGQAVVNSRSDSDTAEHHGRSSGVWVRISKAFDLGTASAALLCFQ